MDSYGTSQAGGRKKSDPLFREKFRSTVQETKVRGERSLGKNITGK